MPESLAPSTEQTLIHHLVVILRGFDRGDYVLSDRDDNVLSANLSVLREARECVTSARANIGETI